MGGDTTRIARASNFLVFLAVVVLVPLVFGPLVGRSYELFTLALVAAVALYRLSQMGIFVDRETVTIQNFWHAHRLPRYRTQIDVEGIEGHTGSLRLDAAHAITGKPLLNIPRMNDDNSPSDSLRISFIDPANPEEVIRPSCIIGTPRGKLPEVCEDLINKIASPNLP